MSNDIEQDRVFIQIDGKGEWLDCSLLSAHSWDIYEAYAEQTETEADTSRDFLVLDTDDYSGIMEHFRSSESFDFKKYSELYEWLEYSSVNCEAVSAYITNHSAEYITQQLFEQEYIGEFKSNQEFLQSHCSESFENIPPRWLDWDAVWNDFKADFFNCDDFYFHNC